MDIASVGAGNEVDGDYAAVSWDDTAFAEGTAAVVHIAAAEETAAAEDNVACVGDTVAFAD